MLLCVEFILIILFLSAIRLDVNIETERDVYIKLFCFHFILNKTLRINPNVEYRFECGLNTFKTNTRYQSSIFGLFCFRQNYIGYG